MASACSVVARCGAATWGCRRYGRHVMLGMKPIMPGTPIWPTMDLLSLEMLLERLVDHLRDGQAVQVRLTPDGLDPAALDMEGDALSLLGGIAGVFQGGLPES